MLVESSAGFYSDIGKSKFWGHRFTANYICFLIIFFFYSKFTAKYININSLHCHSKYYEFGHIIIYYPPARLDTN